MQNQLFSSLLSKDLKTKICRNIIWPVVLYGCETWSLTFREVRRLRVCEKRVLRRIFGLKGDEVSVEWRKLHMEELNELYCSLNIFSDDQMERNVVGGAYSTYGGTYRCIQDFGAET